MNGVPEDFAGDDHHLALAGLLLCRAAIGAVLFAVRLPDLAAEIRAINRHGAGELGFVAAMNL